LKKVTTISIITLLMLCTLSQIALGDDVGVYDTPNAAAPGHKFKIEYINFDRGKNVVVEFYPLLSQLLPYQYTADEYHGKPYGNLTRLISISQELSASWSVTPSKINLKTAGKMFNITVTLNSVGYWDMLLIFKYPNGTTGYMLHSITQVVKSVNFDTILPWLALYFGLIFIILFIILPIRRKRKVMSITAQRKP